MSWRVALGVYHFVDSDFPRTVVEAARSPGPNGGVRSIPGSATSRSSGPPIAGDVCNNPTTARNQNLGVSSLRVAISFPPFKSDKGIPLLSQNRRYQVFSTRASGGSGVVRLLNRFVGNNATLIFPVLPALAATLLKRNGHEAIWMDGIAEGWTWEEYCRQLELARPDLIVIETKTPSAPQIYQSISDLKLRFPEMKIALLDDHVTALPEEAFLFCNVDFTIRGGQFDFATSTSPSFGKR